MDYLVAQAPILVLKPGVALDRESEVAVGEHIGNDIENPVFETLLEKAHSVRSIVREPRTQYNFGLTLIYRFK